MKKEIKLERKNIGIPDFIPLFHSTEENDGECRSYNCMGPSGKLYSLKRFDFMLLNNKSLRALHAMPQDIRNFIYCIGCTDERELTIESPYGTIEMQDVVDNHVNDLLSMAIGPKSKREWKKNWVEFRKAYYRTPGLIKHQYPAGPYDDCVREFLELNPKLCDSAYINACLHPLYHGFNITQKQSYRNGCNYIPDAENYTGSQKWIKDIHGNSYCGLWRSANLNWIRGNIKLSITLSESKNEVLRSTARDITLMMRPIVKKMIDNGKKYRDSEGFMIEHCNKASVHLIADLDAYIGCLEEQFRYINALARGSISNTECIETQTTFYLDNEQEAISSRARKLLIEDIKKAREMNTKMQELNENYYEKHKLPFKPLQPKHPNLSPITPLTLINKAEMKSSAFMTLTDISPSLSRKRHGDVSDSDIVARIKIIKQDLANRQSEIMARNEQTDAFDCTTHTPVKDGVKHEKTNFDPLELASEFFDLIIQSIIDLFAAAEDFFSTAIRKQDGFVLEQQNAIINNKTRDDCATSIVGNAISNQVMTSPEAIAYVC